MDVQRLCVHCPGRCQAVVATENGGRCTETNRYGVNDDALNDDGLVETGDDVMAVVVEGDGGFEGLRGEETVTLGI